MDHIASQNKKLVPIVNQFFFPSCKWATNTFFYFHGPGPHVQYNFAMLETLARL